MPLIPNTTTVQALLCGGVWQALLAGELIREAGWQRRRRGGCKAADWAPLDVRAPDVADVIEAIHTTSSVNTVSPSTCQPSSCLSGVQRLAELVDEAVDAARPTTTTSLHNLAPPLPRASDKASRTSLWSLARIKRLAGQAVPRR
jgi:hypothetical protein